MSDYDVIVVGAGPAGTIAAYECAKRGLDTVLLEKFALPREKPCGGAVMYRGVRVVNGEIPAHLIERKIYGLSFTLPKLGAFEFVTDKLIGITVFREYFDEYLARRASESGVTLIEEARVVDAHTSSDSVSVTLEDRSEYSGSFLIGADGVNSIVSRSLGLRPKRKDLNRHGIGMEADFHVGEAGVEKATDGNPHILSILPVKGKLGYGWVFPKREHLAIGVAGPAADMLPLRPSFERFCELIGCDREVELVPEKIRTYFLGADGLQNKNVLDRVILVGDAAGFVDPMMGEGIAYAMQSGVFAAEVISNAMETGQYNERYLFRYQKLCDAEFGSSFGMAEWAGSQGSVLAERLLPKINGHPLAAQIMAQVARGEIGYCDIPATVLRILPQELPSILRSLIRSRISGASQKDS
ncbi:MAG: Digeranylgeranylglycerophospholipid reductase [Candidatus Thorarchaeota archaeon]|nr:MAG: Digeranylgeranylglycerophospholipid reductase [Candidatus Thorarchaeota archaeon]